MTQKTLNLDNPITDEIIESFSTGDIVLLSGTVYTARDAAHKRIVEAIEQGAPLPFELKGAAIYYTGPSPARECEIIGSCGPTSSARMDDYTPLLLEKGLKIMIGKGIRSSAVIDSMKKHKAVYLAAVGGAAVYLKQFITSSEVIAYPELGTEAVHRLTVKDLPAIVAIDCKGNDIYKR